MSNTLMLSIDFINDIAHPDGKIASAKDFIKEHHTIENANTAIQYARDHNIPIAHVKVGFSENYLECPKWSPVFGKAAEYKALQLGTWGTEFIDTLQVEAVDAVITKHRVSAFYATDLETYLRANKIDTLIIFGLVTNNGVELTAREAHDRDYKVVIVEDACGAVTQDAHDHSIEFFTKIAKVGKAAELSTLLAE